jgi:hypothetical protein
VTNILEIVHPNQRSGEQFYQAPPGTAQAFPSLAEQTINSYSNGDEATKSAAGSPGLECFGCGGPHPWSKREHGKWAVIYPNATKPGIQECATLQISQFQTRKKKQAREYKKKKIIKTLYWEDLPAKSQERILLQQQLVSLVVTQDNQNVSSSITGATGINCLGTKYGSVTLHQDVVIILSSDTTKPPIPIVIHSPMAHVTLQTGLFNEERDCLALKCVFDFGAALSTANFHFMEAVIRQYPHILKKIYLPNNYAAIILSGIVNTLDSTPITTELNVGIDIHLP